jgi:hypothetical protein
MASSARRAGLPLALGIVVSACALAEDTSGRWVDVEFPHDSPVLFVSFSLGSTTARVLRASMALDLHTSLQLRNTGKKTICGLTLRVEAQDLTPSGKGSVTVPSLNVQPGEVFPVRIDMELLRPLNVVKSEGAMVQVTLDCALFSDLSYYGPDKLDSRRALTVYELEARRDRRYLAGLLETGKLAQLREELNFGLQDRSPPQLGLELLRVPASAPKGEQAVNVGAVLFPSSPVQPMGGAARVFGNQVRAPRVEVKNRSQKAVRTVEMGWIVRDERGKDFVAGSVPASMQLGPVQTGILTEPGMLRVSRATGQPLLIGAVMAFVGNVEFADGNLWIPSRRDITEATSDLMLRRALAASPEQQRLAEIYRKKGINALAAELKRVN